MFFLEPIWLVAMAGIVLPVVVHFWNDRRGKVLRIGSIHLLGGVSQRMAWSRRISQWLLLLVRCLLVIALAFLLAGPYLRRGGSGNKGWVLADTGALRVYGGRIDSLVRVGWEKHELSEDHWGGFRAADRVAPEGVKFFVFSSGLAARFVGERPVSSREVHWEVYAPVDSVREWVERAWMVSGDSVREQRAVTRGTGSVFRFGTKSGRGDTSVLSISIYTDAGAVQDGRYLAAGLGAVQAFTRRRMDVRVGAGGSGKWLFWLSPKPVPADVAGRFGKVWQYAMGEEKKVDTRMGGAGLFREIGGLSPDGDVVWADGFGRGVLSRKEARFVFYSRLDPNWGGLVWSRQFPVLLARLLFGEEGMGEKDLRMMDVAQVAPVRGASQNGGVSRGGVDLGQAGWVLIFLLFILERWLSGRE